MTHMVTTIKLIIPRVLSTTKLIIKVETPQPFYIKNLQMADLEM